MKVKMLPLNMTSEDFNLLYSVGDKFHYFPIISQPRGELVTTRSEAWTLGHGAVVVSVDNRSGGLSIEHLAPVVNDSGEEEQQNKLSYFVDNLTEWHKNQLNQLNLVLENKDADIVLGNGIPDVKAGSDTAKGVRIGVMLALSLLGKLPFTVKG